MSQQYRITVFFKNRLTRLLISPFILALIATLLVILLLPYRFPKYTLGLVEKKNAIESNLNNFYDDLDGNGWSDRILVFNSPVGNCGISVSFNPGRKAAQWDFYGQYDFEFQDYVITGDYNHDGVKEIYAVSISRDSIFLNIIDDIREQNPHSRRLFISLTGLENGKSNVTVRKTNMEDLDGDGCLEVIFAISADYTVFPRKLFVYNVAHDSLLFTPDLGINIQRISLFNRNALGEKVILLDTYASGNVKDSLRFPHDRNSWLIGVDQNLRYLFPPWKAGIIHSISRNFLINGKQRYLIGTWISTPGDNHPEVHLVISAMNGKECRRKNISQISESLPGSVILFQDKIVDTIPVVNEAGEVLLLDTSLQIIKKIPPCFTQGNYHDLDIDGDGTKEIIVLSEQKDTLTVLRNDLRDPVSINIVLGPVQKNSLSVVSQPGYPPLLSIYTGKFDYLLAYRFHSLYYWKWAIYLGIYLVILAFTLMVQKLQRLQTQKRLDTEKKITELQLKIVRNQMDPHFTMNAINAVVDAINREEKEQARDNLLHFSKMYRSLVLSADKIKRPLSEELEFTESYLALERFRFGNRFTYQILVDACIDRTREVPKMVILSPVENAVKHGIRAKGTGGEIVIEARMEGPALVLEIRDNGIGREAAAAGEKSGTGKGLEIMEQFFDLYQRITGTSVLSKVSDLRDADGHAAGTSVRIIIE